MSINDDPIDSLLDQAEAYAQRFLAITTQDDDASEDSVNLPPLSLSIPSHHLTTLTSILEGDTMEVKDTEKGKGFYAKRDLEVGERLVIAKPVTLVMGCEVEEDDDSDEGNSNDDDDDDSSDEECAIEKTSADNTSGKKQQSANDSDEESTGSSSRDPLDQATGTKRNGLILLHTLQSLIENPSIWRDSLSNLFPRKKEEVLALPPWICSDASVGIEIETMNDILSQSFDAATAKDIQTRLPLIVRYNVLSIETSSEMFVYPDAEKGGMINLEATGLFGPEVSFFNHSCEPNVSR